MLSAAQLRKLAETSRRYDRAVGHFTTRQNMQLNWPQFEETPDILAELASVEMHAVQTSGNCIRNITTDHFAGVAPDETDRSAPAIANCCGNGRPSTRNSPSCRASSRSRSMPRPRTAP
jgi:sulfite reductase (NADPH) hemoprotein beta-component